LSEDEECVAIGEGKQRGANRLERKADQEERPATLLLRNDSRPTARGSRPRSAAQ
jgi:hypothetical protein